MVEPVEDVHTRIVKVLTRHARQLTSVMSQHSNEGRLAYMRESQ